MAQETVGGAQQWQQVYGYDMSGNRWVTGYTPGTATPSASSNYGTTGAGKNQLSGVSYDLAGNQEQISGVALQYDGENRQIASTVNSIATNYLYDGEGRRVEKITGAASTVYVHDATGNVVAEYSTQAPVVGGTEYLTTDHLGSTRLVTNSAGTAIACHDYLPFGEELLAPESGRSGCYGPADGVVQKFTGKERDAETAGSATPSGLDYFGARYM
ncbi:MAG: RHS repeat-associated core domain-containing protein, partial [Bryobacteraceae bacterium]